MESTALATVQLDPNSAYLEFRSALDKAKEDNANVVFIYEDPKGNKAARSHVHTLRLLKGRIEAARKGAKQAALDYGREVDALAKTYTAEVEEMIAVHEAPLLLIENREKERVAALQARLDALVAASTIDPALDSVALQARLDDVRAVVVDQTWQEFSARASVAQQSAVAALESAHAAAVKREEEAAELDRLRAEAAERAQRERDERIAREAREKAEREAKEREEEAAKQAAAREAAIKEKAEREAREAKEREDRAKEAQKQAEERAERAAQEERERIAREQAEAAARLERERLEREANAAHVAEVKRAAVDALLPVCGVCAPEVIEAIAEGRVPGVSIAF